jgi:hypothetical protein
MRQWAQIMVLAAFGLALIFIPGTAQNPKPPEKPKPENKNRELMHRKLENSQKLLEALVMNDLDSARKHSEELLKIRKDPDFKVLKTREYELWSEEFTASVEDLIKAAKDGNLESAKLQYLGMTMSCFHCHTYTRDARK